MPPQSKLPRICPTTPILLRPEPLTPTSFSPFGTAILPPLPQHLTTIPSTVPEPIYPNQQPRPAPANQNTALKTSPISPLVNNYPSSTTTTSNRDEDGRKGSGKGLMSIFSCFPRQNTYIDPATNQKRLKVEILERHPFTTQTFCPFNFSVPSSTTIATSTRRESPVEDEKEEEDEVGTYFLIIVAPTISDHQATPSNPPDLSKVRAFIAPVVVDGDGDGDGGLGMAVTYAPGTWHAPMVVVGRRRVDFLVTQFVNGREEDDCQEVLVGSQPGMEELGVQVDLNGLGMKFGKRGEGVGVQGENYGLWSLDERRREQRRAKL